ncbi:hypothetical protein H4582DRAFT_1972776 [Lactarius indigo]|nr:hypothetical protein H4582DRAFT_1972776 [Lactarius indigo]
MSDISGLRQSFKGDIVTPGDANYEEAIARWAANAQRPARIVAFVKDTTDVSLALKYARDNNLQVAIRCGGHSASGASSAKDGLVVDLSRYFNYAVVDPERRIVRVGGGTLWETVEKESIKHELATVGGTVNHVRNILLLLLGGGYGFLTGQHGLVVDNLLQVYSLSATPHTHLLRVRDRQPIVTANADTENADLFWGIRGGGSNFGICTEFILRLHPQRPTVFAGMAVYPTEVLRELMTVLTRWWKRVKNNEGIIKILSRDPLSGKECIALLLFYNGSEKDGRENFKEFFDLSKLKPVFDDVKEIPFEKLNTLTNDFSPHGGNYYMKSIYQSHPRFDVVNAVLEKLTKLNAAPGNEVDHVYLFEYIPHHTAAHSNGTNNTPQAAQAAKRAAFELTDIVAKAEAQASGTEANSGYGNFDSETQAEITAPTGTSGRAPARSLDDSNTPQYDPENVFFRWFAITPNPKARL